MTDYTRDVVRKLKDFGWTIHRRGKGDHTIWIDAEHKQTIPVDGTIKSRHSANGIMKEAGISYKF